MRYLLDTHIFLWWVLNNPKLDESARDAIEKQENDVYVSAASTWEMIIKHSIGKLSLPGTPEDFIQEQLLLNDMLPLPISIGHTLALAELPLIHKDPFDRMLIAQARSEGLVLITDDPLIKHYTVEIL